MRLIKTFLFFSIIFSLSIGVFLIAENIVRPNNDKSIIFKDKNNTFETSKESFSFAVFGDTHSNFKIYEKVIDSVNKSGATFSINLGDLTAIGALSEFKEGNEINKKSKIPLYMTVGNHDVIKNKNYFSQFFSKKYYSFDFKNVHFVILDNVSDKDNFDEKQLTWFEGDLKNNKNSLIFIFMHIPPKLPYASPETAGFKTQKSQENLEIFLEICKKYKVTRIYSGHFHNFFRYKTSGIPVTITGGAGGPIYDIPFLDEKHQFHYLLVKIKENEYNEEVIEVVN